MCKANLFTNSPNFTQFKFRGRQMGRQAATSQVQKELRRKRQIRSANLDVGKGLQFKCKSLPAGHQDPRVDPEGWKIGACA